jgi:MoaA/NifB/PqqE/SkfB family radical SAM enzyme
MQTTTRLFHIFSRAAANQLLRKPLAVSFEVTHCCNARCRHCHLGGPVEEQAATPEQIGRICKEIGPVIAQLSGGEPLLRRDLEQIVEAIHRPNRPPYIDITTNGFLLTPQRYESLLQAGVDQIGISLDYPDLRHDAFRGLPGLFGRIEKLMESLRRQVEKPITLICTIQRDNFRDLPAMAELAYEWGVKVNFSAYTWLRTKSPEYLLAKRELAEFREVIERLEGLRKRCGNIFTSRRTFEMYARFFEKQSIPHCQTGVKFFNVNPDGTISPCGLIIKGYCSQKELREKFSSSNNCSFCYTSIRANTEKPLMHHIADVVHLLKAY